MADAFRGFVGEPNCGRGTLSIVWNCLSTIFLSTWTTFHSDVYGENWLSERIQLLVLCIVVPEWAAAVALNRAVDTYYLRCKLRKPSGSFGGWDRLTWKQSFLIGIDGVVVKGEGILKPWR